MLCLCNFFHRIDNYCISHAPFNYIMPEIKIQQPLSKRKCFNIWSAAPVNWHLKDRLKKGHRY